MAFEKAVRSSAQMTITFLRSRLTGKVHGICRGGEHTNLEDFYFPMAIMKGSFESHNR